jgi:hypothetical protein
MSDESDVAIAEIRQVRHAISERLGHDPQQVIAYYIELQRQYAGRCLPTEGEEFPEEQILTPHTFRRKAFFLRKL